jgi:hypothetical protein
MSQRSDACSLILAWIILLTPAPGSAVESSAASFQEWIDLLDSKDLHQRKWASDSLEAAGSGALPVLKKLELALALEPKRVTLQVDDQPLPEVLKEIARQTGCSVHVDPEDWARADPDKRFHFKMKGVAFWEAIDQIHRQSRHILVVDGVHDQVPRIIRQSNRFRCYRGAFCVEATDFHEDRDANFTALGPNKRIGKVDHLLTLGLSVTAEPRFQLIAVEPAEVTVAIDENGQSLRDSLDTRLEPGLSRNSRSTLSLMRASDRAKVIQGLRGFVPVHVVLERKRVVMTNNVLGSKGSKVKVGDDLLEITDAARPVQLGGEITIVLDVPEDKNGVDRNWSRRISLEDPDGKKFTLVGRGYFGRKKSFQFQNPENMEIGPPARLIAEDWKIVRYRIPFEFKNVPLP